MEVEIQECWTASGDVLKARCLVDGVPVEVSAWETHVMNTGGNGKGLKTAEARREHIAALAAEKRAKALRAEGAVVQLRAELDAIKGTVTV